MQPGAPYPLGGHPADRSFAWNRGRTIPALQLVAISSGRGTFETRTRCLRVGPGDVFLVPPGHWHRYRPDPTVGWTEEWFELRGAALETWHSGGVLDFPIVNMAANAEFWERFDRLHDLCSKHPMGFQPIAAGLAFTLLAQAFVAASAESNVRSSGTPELIRDARRLLLGGVKVADVARQLGVSYPTLHRRFKRITGLTPKDYVGQIRMARAEEMLAGTKLSVKEVAARLGYHSASHFSLEFKRVHGVPPRDFHPSSGLDAADGSRGGAA